VTAPYDESSELPVDAESMIQVGISGPAASLLVDLGSIAHDLAFEHSAAFPRHCWRLLTGRCLSSYGVTSPTKSSKHCSSRRTPSGGGGVDRAVHAAASPWLLLQASPALAPCPPGGAVTTEAFDLAPVRWVIHAVGRIYRGPQDAATLASAYTQFLARADEVGATSVAFPSISTGAYGYPLAQAAAVSVQALCGAVTAVQSVLLVAFQLTGEELWDQALKG